MVFLMLLYVISIFLQLLYSDTLYLSNDVYTKHGLFVTVNDEILEEVMYRGKVMVTICQFSLNNDVITVKYKYRKKNKLGQQISESLVLGTSALRSSVLQIN